MGQTAHHYLIFETAGGFCGIAWNKLGITRFQLPTKSAKATEQILRRRVSGAKPGAPTPEVIETVAAVKRYFEGEKTDFSDVKLDLSEQDALFKQLSMAWLAGTASSFGILEHSLSRSPRWARPKNRRASNSRKDSVPPFQVRQRNEKAVEQKAGCYC